MSSMNSLELFTEITLFCYFLQSNNGLEVIRTPNLPLAKRALYQIELQARDDLNYEYKVL